jgi:hypothetical protein
MTLVLKLGGFLALALAVGDAAAAQKKNPYRNYTEEKFVENMQAAGRNYAAVTDLVAGGDYESAKAQLTRAREQLAITITFWRDRQKDDAVRMLRDALNGMDGLTPRSRRQRRACGGEGGVRRPTRRGRAMRLPRTSYTKAYRLKQELILSFSCLS